MDFIVNCFQDSFLAEFVAKFLAIKTDNKISRLSLDLFLRPSMAGIMAGNGYFMRSVFVCYCWQFNNMLHMCKICYYMCVSMY